MQSLLLISHGSRKEESNQEVLHLTEKLAEQAKPQFGFVQCAFLELALPSISEGLDVCIKAGASKVVVLPYFLATGRHVSEDIPAEIKKKRNEYPHVQIKLSQHVGSVGDMMIQALLKLSEL